MESKDLNEAEILNRLDSTLAKLEDGINTIKNWKEEK